MTSEEEKEFEERMKKIQEKYGLCPSCEAMYNLGRADERVMIKKGEGDNGKTS